MYAQLMAQSHLKPLYDTIAYTWNDTTQSLEPDIAGLVGALQTRLAQDPGQALADYGELTWGLNQLGGLAAEVAGRLNAEPGLAALAAAYNQRPDPLPLGSAIGVSIELGLPLGSASN